LSGDGTDSKQQRVTRKKRRYDQSGFGKNDQPEQDRKTAPHRRKDIVEMTIEMKDPVER